MTTRNITGENEYVEKYLKLNVEICEGKGSMVKLKVKVEVRRQERAQLY